MIQEPDHTNVLLQYKRALGLWSSHCADEAVFGSAAVYANSSLSLVAEANCIHGELDEAAGGEAMRYFTEARVRPQAWYLPGASPAITPLRDERVNAWRLDSLTMRLPQSHPMLTIISARASFPHVREIAAVMRPSAPAEQSGEAAMCHLDDARVDALLALHDGRAVAYASVISTGEVGFIMELFVREDLRRRGIGTTMMGRLLDICARSLFKSVFCPVSEKSEGGNDFVHQVGFSIAETFTHRC